MVILLFSINLYLTIIGYLCNIMGKYDDFGEKTAMAWRDVNFQQFSLKYPNENACRKKLFQMRWPDGFICPDCGCREYYFIEKRQRYQCKGCRKQHSVTSGTIMHKTHLPLITWFWAMYLVSRDKRAFSATRISDELNISIKAAWFLLHRLRKAMGNEIERSRLSGIVEIGEVNFGKSATPEPTPRGIGKQTALVGLSVDPDGKPLSLRIQLVENRRGSTIGRFAKRVIAPGSLIQTDELRCYHKSLQKNHLKEYSLESSNHMSLRWLKTIVMNAKLAIEGTFHGLDSKYLQSYFDEFCFRFNFRHKRELIFKNLMRCIMESKPFTFADLKINH